MYFHISKINWKSFQILFLSSCLILTDNFLILVKCTKLYTNSLRMFQMLLLNKSSHINCKIWIITILIKLRIKKRGHFPEKCICKLVEAGILLWNLINTICILFKYWINLHIIRLMQIRKCTVLIFWLNQFVGI